MSPLDLCIGLHRAQASLRLKLDDELGTLHGIGWDDFVLLAQLAAAPDGVPLRELDRPMGVRLSGVVRRLGPLEKTGLLARRTDGAGVRRVLLRPAARGLVKEARETAEAICEAAMPARQPIEALGTLAAGVAASPALRLA